MGFNSIYQSYKRQYFRIYGKIAPKRQMDFRFHLHGKKVLLKEENQIEIVLVDVTESPIECPKKSSD
jgi:hypothetical protein